MTYSPMMTIEIYSLRFCYVLRPEPLFQAVAVLENFGGVPPEKKNEAGYESSIIGRRRRNASTCYWFMVRAGRKI